RVEQNLAAGEERRERAYLVAHARRLLVGDAEEQRALELLLRSRQAVAQHARARRVRDLAPLDDVSLPVVERVEGDVVQRAVRHDDQATRACAPFAAADALFDAPEQHTVEGLEVVAR